MEFTFVFEGKTLTSPDKYMLDEYRNRFMIFSDTAGNKFKISRDALEINLETGTCSSRNNEINVIEL